MSSHPLINFMTQPTNQSMFDFEAQTMEPSCWFWGPNHQTVATGFEVQTEKPSTTLVYGSIKKPIRGFEAKPEETVATSFKAKSEKTVATGFKVKPEKTIPVILRPNHWQTIELDFEAQPRNLRSSSPRARCWLHTAPPELSIARPPSTRPVRPSLILCSMFPTPAMILITACHAAPTTCTPRDKQT
jgi:hypothetical protein